jgi:hypothetical protein
MALRVAVMQDCQTPAFRRLRLLRLRVAVALTLLLPVGCAVSPPPSPYPHEYLLTVFAELKLYLDQDPYRLPPGRDLEGHNVFRVTLERLDSLSELADPAYADVMAFARGQCLERLGDWTRAAEAFDRATSPGTTLADAARARAQAARRMVRLTDRDAYDHASLEGYLNDLQVMERRLLEWAAEKPPPYKAYALLEAARGREERARLLFDHRRILKDGAARAIQLAQSLTADFQESYRASEHWLLLGSLYEQLARDFSRQFPPEGRGFDPDGRWRQWIEQARVAYRKVALADGDPAKPEGQALLRGLDAYALRMQDLAR